MKFDNQSKNQSLTLNDIVLIAALELSDGDIGKSFTAEELLVKSWKNDNQAFGLRGFEREYPDSNILYTKLMGKSGLVRTGFLKKIAEKTYTITEAGLSVASSLIPTGNETKTKIERQLHDAIVTIINHPIFIKWLTTSGNEPTRFRDAMWFWGLAPGIPPKTGRERIATLERTLYETKKKVQENDGKIAIETRNFSKETKNQFSVFDERKGYLFLDILDINRCIEFHNTLKERFKKELNYILKEN